MNIPEDCRAIYCADEGKTLIAFDKSQAEARVVAYKSWLCSGDDSYKKLLEANIKPHIWFGNILCDRGIFPSEERANINAKLGTYYLLAKKSVHGFSYGMGPLTFKRSLLSETDGAVNVEVRLAKTIKDTLYASLTAIPKWHLAIQKRLAASPSLISALGRSRNFLDHWGESMFGEAYAFEPQAIVADDTARSMEVLSAYPYIEFLQQGYDSVLLQVPTPLVKDALEAIRTCATQPITLTDFDCINNTTIIIPISIKIGQNWQEMKEI